MSDRRYTTTTSGGLALRRPSALVFDHVSSAIAAARRGTPAWVKSWSPADELAGFYGVEFAPVRSVPVRFPVTVTAVVDGRPILPPDLVPPWVDEIARVALNILNSGGTPQ